MNEATVEQLSRLYRELRAVRERRDVVTAAIHDAKDPPVVRVPSRRGSGETFIIPWDILRVHAENEVEAIAARIRDLGGDIPAWDPPHFATVEA